MNVKKIGLLLVFLFPWMILAQGESNNWYFGFGAGLHFNNNGTVEVIYDGEIISYEGSASISGPSGDFLFYTDGRTIYNRNHLVMSNGDNLFGNPSSTMSAVIIPLPQSPDIYYVFTVDATTNGVRGRGLNYSVVDMSQDSGNGSVIQKNVNLLEDCSEKVTAVLGDCSAENLWIVTQATETGAKVLPPGSPNFNTYHAFEMNATGVNATSVKSTFTDVIIDDRGYLKVSPDATKIASCNNGYPANPSTDGLFISDFDATTGVVSNQQQIIITNTLNTFPYGAEFSPNSQYLYIHTTTGVQPTNEQSSLLQYDMLAADISGSQVSIEERRLFRGALQLGPDGKIYRTLSLSYENGSSPQTFRNDGPTYLGVINNPNEQGLACNYLHNAIQVNGNRVRQGLPPLVQSFFTEINLVPDDNLITGELGVCLGDTLRLEAQAIAGATYSWEKDGVAFNNNPAETIFEVPSSTMANSGLYKVYITRPGAINCPIEGEALVLVSPIPEADPLNILRCDIDLDNYSDGITTFDLTELEIDPSLIYTYYVSELDRDMDIAITNPTSFRNTTAFNQQMYFKVTNMNGCENQGELNLTVVERPELSMASEYVLCTNGPSLTIDGPNGLDAYQWLLDENGLREVIGTSQTISITTIGTYVLIVNVEYVVGTKIVLCSNEVIFEVRASSSATIDEIRATGSGNNKTIEVVANGEGDYEYSLDGVNFQDANTFENLEPGDYTAYVSDKLECGVTERQFTIEKDLFVGGFPKFFTPNGDGINDYWQFIPPETGEINVDAIYIFNKYGQLMVELNPTSPGWDGIFNGRRLPSTDYWFKAISLNLEQISGHFTLKR